MTRTRKIALALLLAVSVSAPAVACMAFLDRTEFISGGVICHYRLSNGQIISIVRPGEYNCPMCLN
jgi:hypothetical protein